MKLNKTLPNAIYRNGKKLGYNRSFKTLAEARKFVVRLKDKHTYSPPLTQIRRVVSKVDHKSVFYAVYSTNY